MPFKVLRKKATGEIQGAPSFDHTFWGAQNELDNGSVHIRWASHARALFLSSLGPGWSVVSDIGTY